MLRAYLQLLRPANVTTALADVLAGFAVAGLHNRDALVWLLVSTACLYAGGVVLNDFFDREIDRLERPERPIPSRRITPAAAATLGSLLLVSGVLAAFGANATAGLVASTIAALVVLYDAWGKRQAAIGPANMGLCRAFNLLLGMAAVPAALDASWPLAIIPLVYIGAVTTMSRGEVLGGDRATGRTSFMFLVLAWLALIAVASRDGLHGWPALVLAAAVGWRVLPPFWRAQRTPAPAIIRTAVKHGVLSLVLVDATIAAAYAGPAYSAVILAVGLFANLLARIFSVT